MCKNLMLLIAGQQKLLILKGLSPDRLNIKGITMKFNKLLIYGAMLLTAIATVGCGGGSKKSLCDIPSKPIEEMRYSPEKTVFELWAPTAERAPILPESGYIALHTAT